MAGAGPEVGEAERMKFVGLWGNWQTRRGSAPEIVRRYFDPKRVAKPVGTLMPDYCRFKSCQPDQKYQKGVSMRGSVYVRVVNNVDLGGGQNTSFTAIEGGLPVTISAQVDPAEVYRDPNGFSDKEADLWEKWKKERLRADENAKLFRAAFITAFAELLLIVAILVFAV